VALITGGSRGLGLLIARELGRLGARVVLAARDEHELARAKSDLENRGVAVATVVTDLSTPAQAERAVDACIDAFGRIDVLVNNAGVITVGPFEHLSNADFQEAMSIHFWAPLYTLQAALPFMRMNGGGRIVNISSIGGKIGVAHLVPYCGSKFALTGLSQAMTGELAKDNIRVTTVAPGLMRTGSPFNAWFKGHHRDEFTWFVVADSVPILTIDAARAAHQIVEACRRGDPDLVITWPAKIAVVANAIAPSAVALAMQVANRLLPGPADAAGDEARSGWQSPSRWAPSWLTRLTERAAVENNQLLKSGDAGRA